jgi:hypothetical protein
VLRRYVVWLAWLACSTSSTDSSFALGSVQHQRENYGPLCCARVSASCAGQAVDSAKALGPSTGCTTPCPGNNSQRCGGSLAFNLYALQKAPWLEADRTTPSLLTGAACVGAAASSDACKGTTPGSAAGAAAVSRVLVGMAAGVAAVALL